MTKKLSALVVALALLLGLGACSNDPGKPDTTVTVFAAASLKNAFEAMVPEFTRQHPDLALRFNFLGSQSLVDQLGEGARADVLATADEKSMAKATQKSLVKDSQIFATNTLVMVTPPDNPAGVTGLDASLDRAKLVICAVQVPCGAATATLARNQHITLKPVSQEQKVTDVLAKVTSGEADAGIVYATDARGAGAKVRTLQLTGADKVVNKYPIAEVGNAASGASARAFIDFVRSGPGRTIMAEHGFGAP